MDSAPSEGGGWPRPPDVSVVAPLHRTATTVEELHGRLKSVLEPRWPHHEVLFVDDACPEGSGRRALALAARDPRVGVLSLSRNVGQHRAVLLGVARTIGRWIVVLDGDLQDPPEAIPLLMDVVERGYDAVFAGRRGAYESGFRLATSRAFKLLLHACGGVPADAGLFLVLSRRLADELASARARRPFVQVLIARAGLPVTSVPVSRAPRRDGSSAYTTTRRALLALDALRLALLPARCTRGPGEEPPPADFLAPAARAAEAAR